MKDLSIREARQCLTGLERLLEQEGELVITRRGRPIARVTGIGGRRPTMPSHRKLRDKTARLARSSEELLREERDGR